MYLYVKHQFFITYLYGFISMFNHGFCSHHYTHAARRQSPEPLEAGQFVFRGIARVRT
jgi:hypothetical protein